MKQSTPYPSLLISLCFAAQIEVEPMGNSPNESLLLLNNSPLPIDSGNADSICATQQLTRVVYLN